MENGIPKGIIAIVAGVFILGAALFFSPFTSVPNGHAGLVSLFGSVQDEVLPAGLHAVNPMAHVTNFNVQQRGLTVDGEVGTKDLQSVHARVVVNFTPSSATAAAIYKNFGPNFAEVIVSPAVQDRLKAVTSHYNAEELITKREEVRLKVKAAVVEAVRERSGGTILVNDVVIADFGFVQSFKNAIEAKQVAEQNALKAENDLRRIKVEAEQRIATARAEAEAFRLQSQQLTPVMVQMEAIKKWDGTMPQFLGSGQLPFVTISK